jgi:hypothetical protein
MADDVQPEEHTKTAVFPANPVISWDAVMEEADRLQGEGFTPLHFTVEGDGHQRQLVLHAVGGSLEQEAIHRLESAGFEIQTRRAEHNRWAVSYSGRGATETVTSSSLRTALVEIGQRVGVDMLPADRD